MRVIISLKPAVAEIKDLLGGSITPVVAVVFGLVVVESKVVEIERYVSVVNAV